MPLPQVWGEVEALVGGRASTLRTLRSPVTVLVGISAAALVTLLLSPFAAVLLAAALLIGGLVARARGQRVIGVAVAATGGALFLAAVLLLALVDADQDEPIILGPNTGLIPGS